MSDTQSTSSNDAQTGEQTAEATSNVGALLREHREKAGLDIADVARVLRISQKYLDALEDGRSADLPGTPYAIGFVRSYAEHLHLDGEEIVRRYKEEVEGLSGKTDLVFPKPIPDGGVPGTAVLALGIIVAAIAYGAWYWQSSQDSIEVARVEPVPEHMAAETLDQADQADESAAPPASNDAADDAAGADETEAQSMAERMEETAEDVVQTVQDTVKDVADSMKAEPEAPNAPEMSAADSAPEVAAEAAEEVADSVADEPAPQADETQASAEEVVRNADEAMEAADTPAVAEEAEPNAETAEPGAPVEPAAVGDPTSADVVAENPPVDGDSRVRLRAKEDNWILVRDTADDRLLFGRVLPKGESYDVPNRPNLILMTGNAGALEVLVDGEAVPSLGGMGEVRRDVSLDPDELKNGSAVGN